MFPSSILLLAFILMCFTLFPNAFCVLSSSLFYSCFHFIFLFTKLSHHRCNIHFSFISLSIYIGICVTCMVSRFAPFLNACIHYSRKICAMEFSLFRARARVRWSHIFFATGDDFVIHSIRAQCALFCIHFATWNSFAIYIRAPVASASVSISQTLQFSFATFLNGHDMLLIASKASIQHDGFMHLFYYCASKTYHWIHIHSYFTSGNIYRIWRFSLRIVCIKKMWTTWNTYVRAAKNIYMKHL